MTKAACLAGLWVALTACQVDENLDEAAHLEAAASPVTPGAPAIMRNVDLVEDKTYQYPYLPGFRTSADGRVALSVKEQVGGNVQIYLNVPEKLDANNVPFAYSANPLQVPAILATTTPFSQHGSHGLPENLFGPADGPYHQQHHTLCDGTMQFPQDGAKTNPYTCGDRGEDDCYRLTVITPVHFTDTDGSPRAYFYGAPITVTVSHPKTADAQIENITVDPYVRGSGPAKLKFNDPLEPMITADGHLLVTRGWGEQDWDDNGTQVHGTYNIVYSVADASADPCDVTQWKTFYPIAHAPHDPDMKGRYGIADYVFRDTEGAEIPENQDLGATYPWIDRMGRNLFFVNVNASLFVAGKNNTVVTRYPERCPDGVDDCVDPTTGRDIPDVEQLDGTRGVTVVGRWTHGKEVQLDALFNNIDYGLQTPDSLQREVKLYQGASDAVWVRMGSGRSNGKGDDVPEGYGVNSTILDSLENVFADRTAFKPLALRDVTWRMNMGKGGDEVSFDDYINPDSFIISEMTASTSFAPRAYHDGYVAPTDDSDGGFVDPLHLQNAATAIADRWDVPAYGLVAKGSAARIEPAALGGIKGKGFWLDPATHIDYAVKQQKRSSPAWLMSIFVDPRFADEQRHRLITYTDGTHIDLIGHTQIEIAHDTMKRTIRLRLLAFANGSWTHLAFALYPSNRVMTYVNGYLLDDYTAPQPWFQLGGGTLSVGDASNGFSGWIDEFKLIAQDVDVETICNHAHGTLVGLSSASDRTWWTTAGYYPDASHSRVASLSGTAFARYACVHDYRSDEKAPYLGQGNVPDKLPDQVVSIRNALHFPEGPLRWNKPRPSSLKNGFCLSCHADGTQVSPTLGLAALKPGGSVLMQDDLRRQPLQLPRRVFGNIPAGYINGTLPTQAMQAPASGTPVDQWTYPNNDL